MPEQTAAQAGKFLAPLCAFAGAVLMLLFKREMEVRKMLIAVASGPLFAWLLTPSAVSWVTHSLAWLPNDGSVSGAVGCIIGMTSINMIAFVAHAGQRAETVKISMGGDK